MGASKAQRAATAARRDAAIKLKMAGADWPEIAAQLGYSDKGAACKDVHRALEQRTRELRLSTDAMRDAEIAELERIKLGMWKKGVSGDVKAADVLLKIHDRRVRMLQLDVDPDVEARIEAEVTAQVGAKMAVVWGQVLAGLDLTAEQAEKVPGLLDAAIARFTAAVRRPAIEGTYVEDQAA